MKKASNIFIILAVILSNIMSAVVAYSYCNMQWGIEYAGYSAPAEMAFINAIPYAVAVAVCIAVAVLLRKRGK